MEDEECEDECCEAEREEDCEPDVEFEDCELAELSPVLLHVFHQVLYSKRDGSQHLHELHNKVVEKASFVALTDAVANPRAVMVVSGDALVTRLAVLRAQRLLQVADRAVLHLDEKFELFL